MLRSHRILVCCLAFSSLHILGCSSFGIKNGTPYWGKPDQWEPVEEEDKWSSVGKIGRGNRELEDERDPFKSMLMSKEAQNIERNLGYK